MLIPSPEDHTKLVKQGWRRYDHHGLAYRYIYLLTIRYLYNTITNIARILIFIYSNFKINENTAVVGTEYQQYHCCNVFQIQMMK